MTCSTRGCTRRWIAVASTTISVGAAPSARAAEPTPATGHGPPSAILPSWVCRSSDGGRTWKHADGRMATASYAERSALRAGCHMATVTWRLPPKK